MNMWNAEFAPDMKKDTQCSKLHNIQIQLATTNQNTSVAVAINNHKGDVDLELPK